MNRLWELYKRPTPDRWRKIGDSILLLGTTLNGYLAGINAHSGWIIFTLVLTWLGKTLTNFVTDNSQTPQP